VLVLGYSYMTSRTCAGWRSPFEVEAKIDTVELRWLDGEFEKLVEAESHRRRARSLMEDAGVSPDGSGSHRIVIVSDAGSFSDPDGFVWEAASV
jgi:hypothetical protein